MNQVATARAAGQPDVQVLIVPSVGGDMVNLTYPRVVPTAQAEHDVTAVLHAGNWHTTDVDISDDALPVEGEASVPMTSVTLQCNGAAPAAGETTLRLEPWIVGLRSYKALAVSYMMPLSTFKFNGLRSYQDSRVQVALDQKPSTFTYHVRILNGNFTSLSLPLTQPASQLAQADSRSPNKLKLLGIIVVGLVAAGVGYAVYMLLSRVH